MKYNNIKYSVLALLLILGAMTSCIDDDILLCEKDDNETPFTDGYAINLAVTIDKMGGTRAATVPQLEEIENYIDPEKFRVLFFDADDKFLFESKSRWIKQLTPVGAGNSQWLVSVPIYTYGNDEEYNWDWEAIREALTGASFKIAILTNRPGEEWCPQFKDTNIDATWFDNTGPHWRAEHTSWYTKKNGGTPKDVFDLHHSQYDPIYTGKSWSAENPKPNEGYYEFVMDKKDDKLQMSSTSSWVDWGTDDNVKDPDFGYRYFIQPSMEHPIPMYGIQVFDKITNWVKGTPFNLSNLTGKTPEDGSYNFNSISLLRSVVRLDLVVPKSVDDSYELKYVLMGYPNIYARCEPMDVWTPTDILWEGEDHTGKGHTESPGACEWYDIINYGPVARINDSSSSTLDDYRKRISWFYGAWLDKEQWTFGNFGRENVQNAINLYGKGLASPRIFNSCIQRNNVVHCGRTDVSDNEFYRYVVYTGERNVNDPSNLSKLGVNASGAATIIYWGLCFYDKVTKTYRFYKVPLTDFSSATNIDQIIYSESVPNTKSAPTTGMQYYENLVQDPDDTTPKPWPLMRNHVYRTYIQPSSSYVWDFTKMISKPTIAILDADNNWSSQKSKGTVILSWNETPTLSRVQTTENPGTNQKNVATWGNGYSIMIMRSDKDIANANDMTINGKKYKGIRLSNGAQNKLTLPDGFGATKMTLYSYRHTNSQNRPCYWKEINGTTYEQSDAQILTNTGDASKPDMCEFTFGTSLQEITFTNTGEQLGYVVFLEVKDENNDEDYWSFALDKKVKKGDEEEFIYNGKELRANNVAIGELGNLNFDNTGTIYIYSNPSKIRLDGETTITFPNLKEGYTITIEGQAVTEGTNPGIEPVRDYLEFTKEDDIDSQEDNQCVFGSDQKYTFKWTVKNSGSNEVKFKLTNGGGIYFYKFRIDAPYNFTRSTGSAGSGFSVKSENLYSKSLKAE